MITDELGRYLYVNQRWCEITGFSPEDVKGLYVHDIMPETRVDEVLRAKRPLKGELVKIRSARGEDIHLLCSYYPIFKNDKLIGCFNVSSLVGMENVMDFNAKTTDLIQELDYYQKELIQLQGAKYSIQNIIGSGSKMRKLKTDIHRAARSASTVMIQGETGSGKELVAHSVHVLSTRATKPFIKINCAAIPGELLESELFGYEPGAFTGASRQGKKGKFLLADKGTLFLDEINQMPLHLQPKLLRALQEKEIEPVGGTRSIPVDCRIIAASNQHLNQLVKANKFREDLYYRLNVIALDVPPLREHLEDIPEIADGLLKRLNLQLGMHVPGISDEAKALLKNYSWPGNVRELQNVIERAMNKAWVDTIGVQYLDSYFRQKDLGRHLENMTDDTEILSIRDAKEQTEYKLILKALDNCSGNKSQAARELGITRAMLYKKLHKYHIDEI